MADMEREVIEKMRRSITGEFVRLEDDFDATRNMRAQLTSKLMQDATKLDLLDKEGIVRGDVDDGIKVINAALKALDATEKASVSAVSMKLRHNEQAIAAAGATKDRIAIVIEATKAGRIEEAIPFEKLEDRLAEMFSDEIQDFELKSNPRSLDESDIS